MKAELYWIQDVGRGRLAMLPRPRAGDWLREEIASLRDDGVDVLVSLLTPYEIGELELDDEPRCCAAIGMEFVSFPIEDMRVPPSVEDTQRLVARLLAQLAAGKGVAVHCRAGIGRSSTIAACVLVEAGVSPEDAFARITAVRGVALPDTDEQREWVQRFALLAGGTPNDGEGS
ncbi:MAG TPA: tyrosine protein phosphatase [Dehalococcoidia bacterium]|nr:tyrosine protein phosphatase [Dehalococcoidia bacterium]